MTRSLMIFIILFHRNPNFYSMNSKEDKKIVNVETKFGFSFFCFFFFSFSSSFCLNYVRILCRLEFEHRHVYIYISFIYVYAVTVLSVSVAGRSIDRFGPRTSIVPPFERHEKMFFFFFNYSSVCAITYMYMYIRVSAFHCVLSSVKTCFKCMYMQLYG